MAGDIRTDITASDIPRFPVLRLTWRSDGTITLDDAPIQIDDSDDARVAALTACAERARERGGDTPIIRVIAHDAASDTTWPMGVTGDGDIVEMETQTAGQVSERKTPRRALVIGGAIAAAGVVAGGGTATALLLRGRNEPEATAPPPPPGSGDLVPVAVPDGYSTTAAWTTEIAQNSRVTALTDGRTLTVAPGTNNLRVHDPLTGAVTFTGTGNNGNLTVDETIIDGRPFLIALAAAGVLKVWPLDLSAEEAGTDLALPNRDALLRTSGPAPAVALPTQVGYIFNGPDGVEVDIPVGYQIIAATPEGQAVVLGARDWGLLTPGRPELDQTTELLLPSNDHAITEGYMLGEDRLLVRAEGPDDATWALYATDSSNALLRQATTGPSTSSKPSELQHSPDRATWAIGDVIATRDSLTVTDGATPTAVTGLGTYADGRDGQLLIAPGSPDPTVLPEGTITPAVADSDRAVLITEKLDTPTAYTVKAI